MSIISALSDSKQVRVKVSCTEFLSQVRDGLREFKSILRKMSVICKVAHCSQCTLFEDPVHTGDLGHRWRIEMIRMENLQCVRHL